MNKDKLTDRRDNKIENKKEDYKDSNGSSEDFIEDMTDPEATDLFKEAFYAEGKALEEEALRLPFVEDEEKKEALRLRILASMERREDEAEGGSAARKIDTVSVENADRETEIVAVRRIEPKVEMTVGENMGLEVKVMAGENVQRKVKACSAAVNGDDALKKKKRHKYTLMARWAAVIILACVGVFGVSMTSQAKGSGLWSSIQRLIGGETRWENDNNGGDRTYTNPEEEKAVSEIEEKLGITIPKFFYWPEGLLFSSLNIFEESNSFMITYKEGDQVVYFEGWKGESNVSSNNSWQGEGNIENVKYDDVTYSIMEIESDTNEIYYYVGWGITENKFSLSGLKSLDEIKNILKNIKY